MSVRTEITAKGKKHGSVARFSFGIQVTLQTYYSISGVASRIRLCGNAKCLVIAVAIKEWATKAKEISTASAWQRKVFHSFC